MFACFGKPSEMTASSGLAVSFSAPSGPCSVSGTTVTITGAGTCTIRASQAGDANYNPAASVDQTFTIRDGSKIAFSSTRDGNLEIYLMNADGTGQTRLTTNAAIDGEPAWSPDGSKLVFSSSRSGNGDIYRMNADGSGLLRLTTSSGIDLSPAVR